jgi:hypothetical protein
MALLLLQPEVWQGAPRPATFETTAAVVLQTRSNT